MKTKLTYYLGGVFAGLLAGAVITAFAHPQADCYKTASACSYVQVDTPGGGSKMVYICE